MAVVKVGLKENCWTLAWFTVDGAVVTFKGLGCDEQCAMTLFDHMILLGHMEKS